MARPATRIGEIPSVWYSQRGDRVQARADIRAATGELRRVSGQGVDQEAAYAALRRNAEALWNGTFSDARDAHTVEQLAATWLVHIRSRRRLRQQTIEVYESYVRTLILRRIPKVPIVQLTPGFVDSFLLRLEQEQSPSAANKARFVIRKICDLAIRHGALAPGTNPIDAVEPIPGPDPRFVEYDLGQVRLILGGIHAWDRRSRNGIGVNRQRLVDLIVIILGTGIRIGEALALRQPGVRFAPDGSVWLTLDGTIVRDRVHGLYRQPDLKRDGQEREQRVADFAADTVRRLMANYGVDAARNPDELLFVSVRGGPVEKVGVARKLQEFRSDFRVPLAEAGIDVDLLTFKSFRKASAKVVADAQGIKSAADLLGHVDPSMTGRFYARPPLRQISAPAAALDAAYRGLLDSAPDADRPDSLGPS